MHWIKSGDDVKVTLPDTHLENGGSIPTSPLQLVVQALSAKKSCELNEQWHSVLPRIPWSNVTRNKLYACYGAFYGDTCVAVGIWSSPVAQNRMKDGNSVLELRRYAIHDIAPKNTASWMMGVMIKLIKKDDRFSMIHRFLSYQDTSAHTGTIYKASGWKRLRETKYADWSAGTRKRNKPQTISDKVCWYRDI